MGRFNNKYFYIIHININEFHGVNKIYSILKIGYCKTNYFD